MSATQTAQNTGIQTPAPNGKARAPSSRTRSRRKRTTRAAAPAAPAAQAAAATPAKSPPAKAAAPPSRAQSPAVMANTRARAGMARGIDAPALARPLFEALPPGGTTWSLERGVAWLEAVAGVVKFACDFTGTLTVKGTAAA
jgi:hypothetical protein